MQTILQTFKHNSSFISLRKQICCVRYNISRKALDTCQNAASYLCGWIQFIMRPKRCQNKTFAQGQRWCTRCKNGLPASHLSRGCAVIIAAPVGRTAIILADDAALVLITRRLQCAAHTQTSLSFSLCPGSPR